MVAWQAWQNTRLPDNSSFGNVEDNYSKEIEIPDSDTFTDEQRFFIAYAQAWRGTIRDEELRNMVLIEEHPWNRYRVNAIPFNLDEFYQAFPDISPDNLLNRNESARARVW